jgi:hypothetical protein
MPSSVQVVVALLGALLVLLGLVTSKINIFGAELSPLPSVSLRRWALFGGVFALIVSLLTSVEKENKPSPLSKDDKSIVINNSPVFNNNASAQPSSTTADNTATASYLDIWRCIPPRYRPDADAQELSSTRPAQSQLTEGLLTMTSMGELGCIKTLLDAGADIDGYRSPRAGNITDGPALHLALREMRWNVALMLLDRGANPNLLTSSDGASAHDEACGSLKAPEYVMKALKSKDAKPIIYGYCKGDSQ